MSRTLKFRAWDKDTKEMFSPVYLLLSKGNSPPVVFSNGEVIRGSGRMHGYSVELMQFTGLKDSKGVDIYEGDVIQWWNKVSKPVVVEPTNGGWNPFIDSCTTDHPYHYEIIGNIYEGYDGQNKETNTV